MLEVQNISAAHEEKLRQTHTLSLVQHKAMNAILNCRTERMGGSPLNEEITVTVAARKGITE